MTCRFCGTPRRTDYKGELLTVGPLAGYRVRRCKACHRILFVMRFNSVKARQRRIQKGVSDNMRSRFGELLTPHGHRIIDHVLRTGYLPTTFDLKETR